MPLDSALNPWTKLRADLKTLREVKDQLQPNLPVPQLRELNWLLETAQHLREAPDGEAGAADRGAIDDVARRVAAAFVELDRIDADVRAGPALAPPFEGSAAAPAEAPGGSDPASEKVRRGLKWLGPILLAVSIASVYLAVGGSEQTLSYLGVALWSMATGGLGAICNAFLRLMNVVDDDRKTDDVFFHFWGRVFLGVLFGLVLGVALLQNGHFPIAPPPAGGKPADLANNLFWLAPFLAGNSLPLVLGIIDKVTQAVELAFALNTGRQSPGGGRQPPDGAPPGTKPTAAATPGFKPAETGTPPRLGAGMGRNTWIRPGGGAGKPTGGDAADKKPS